MFSKNKAFVYKKMLACVRAFQFEEAFKICRQHNVRPFLSDMDQIINALASQRESMEVISSPYKFDRRLKALQKFRDHECDPCDPGIIIEKTILPEGYMGRILIVAVTGGVIGKLVCLRSGDLWHREILKNTENEIRELGFFESSVHELGGAHVRFETNKDIVIFGTSDEYGSCDKVYASRLIQQVFKNRNIMIF
ncbi:MAG: hypothetical protein GY864_00710 [Desulfobacterales bacterium]|nr:hypothetical protein [Desulfobacterales bacterium]